ncbi:MULTISPECIES: hypothetical protein [Gottfriedia]|uniref:Uncharacterized protein n=1 Tax=Gottfriedia solisilvae TaxID=1516104 RepID=A0A8J3EX46_9BACI|nr:hypothetical protein [Gottfriedia solisilvae]GGI11500.1 hypothetical protein GCM10007380_08150 [Gottfriedia solisilvae]
MIKRSKLYIIGISALIILSTYISPSLSIRSYMFIKGHPIVAFSKLEYIGNDKMYGKGYYSEGWEDRLTGSGVSYFYAKRSIIGMYWVSSGSGP